MERLSRILHMLAENEEDPFLLFALAKEYESLDKLPEAIEIFEKLRAVDPNYIGLYYHLAHLYSTTRQIDLSIQTYEDGINIASGLGDQHALSELKNAFMNFQIEEDS